MHEEILGLIPQNYTAGNNSMTQFQARHFWVDDFPAFPKVGPDLDSLIPPRKKKHSIHGTRTYIYL